MLNNILIFLPTWASVWGMIEIVVGVIIGLVFFVRLWRTKVVRKFITTTLGIAELQTSVQELLEKENELLKKERDDYKTKLEKAERDFAELYDADEREMAGMVREIDARRVVNDQDKRVIEAYVNAHGDALKIRILEEELHVTRPADRQSERADAFRARGERRRGRGADAKTRSSDNLGAGIRDR